MLPAPQRPVRTRGEFTAIERGDTIRRLRQDAGMVALNPPNILPMHVVLGDMNQKAPGWPNPHGDSGPLIGARTPVRRRRPDVVPDPRAVMRPDTQ